MQTDRQTDRETDRETDRQRDRQTNRQIDRQTDRQKSRQSEINADRLSQIKKVDIIRQNEIGKFRKIDRLADKQADALHRKGSYMVII